MRGIVNVLLADVSSRGAILPADYQKADTVDELIAICRVIDGADHTRIWAALNDMRQILYRLD